MKKSTINKLIFFISIALSICSFLLSLRKKKEIYPFFYWKLYTQPLGNIPIYKDYRLYGIKNADTIRISNKGYRYLNQDDYYYFLSNEVNKLTTKNLPITYHKQRINDLGKLIAPQFDHFILMEESFSPSEIIRNHNNFSKKIILISE